MAALCLLTIAKGNDETVETWDKHVALPRGLFVKNEFEDTYGEPMKYDQWSVRTYLTMEKGLPADVINWFETVESRTGLLDESLTETVLASLVFMDPVTLQFGDINWFCLEYVFTSLHAFSLLTICDRHSGGSEEVHKLMTDQVKSKPVRP